MCLVWPVLAWSQRDSTSVDDLGEILPAVRDELDRQNITWSEAEVAVHEVEIDPSPSNLWNIFRVMPLDWQIGAMWSRPMRFNVPFVCLWIYGLATGEGLAAKVFSSDLMVKFLSPASYAIYLSHWATYDYWFFFR